MRESDITKIFSQFTADELNAIDRRTREVVRGVEETGKAGEITLKIKIKQNGKNSTIVSVEDKYKVPKPAVSERVMYFAYNDTLQATGELSDMPPKQEPLFGDDSNVRPIGGKTKTN
jgi:hypothetical protein